MMNLPELPVIVRARDYRLYDHQGRRFIDFFQDGGRAILGHRPNKLSLTLKNTLSRGLLAGLPSIYTGRLEKALRSLLPEYSGFRVYEHRLKTDQILTEKGFLRSGESVPDIFFTPEGNHPTLSVWRPFLEETSLFPDIIIPVLPFPGGFTPSVLCFREISEDLFPPSDICSPFLLAGLTRIVYDLIRETKERDRSTWFRFDISPWQRVGPYLIPSAWTDKEYRKMFIEFLEKGILLNPEYSCASIIPGEYNEGEIDYFISRSK